MIVRLGTPLALTKSSIATAFPRRPSARNSSPGVGWLPVMADGRSHAKDSVYRPQVQPQGITTNVAGVDSLGQGLADGVKCSPVRASGAKRRASGLTRDRGLFFFGNLSEIADALNQDIR